MGVKQDFLGIQPPDPWATANYTAMQALATALPTRKNTTVGWFDPCMDTTNCTLAGAASDSASAFATVVSSSGGLLASTDASTHVAWGNLPTAFGSRNTGNSCRIITNSTSIYVLTYMTENNGASPIQDAYYLSIANLKAGTISWSALGYIGQILPGANGSGFGLGNFLEYNGYTYLFGYQSGTADAADSSVRRISSSMLITSYAYSQWSVRGSMPDVYCEMGIISIGNYVYSVGGRIDYTVVNTIKRQLLTDLEAGNSVWTDCGTLPVAMCGVSLLMIGTDVYLYGGATTYTALSHGDMSSAVSTIYKKSVTDFTAGTGTWTAVNASCMPGGGKFCYGCPLVLDGYLYNFGGAPLGARSMGITRQALAAGGVSQVVAIYAALSAGTSTVARVKIRLLNQDSTAACDMGSSGSNKIEAYLSLDNNVTFGSALSFTSAADTEVANAYWFTTADITVASGSTIGLKIMSFARSAFPTFKILDAGVEWR